MDPTNLADLSDITEIKTKNVKLKETSFILHPLALLQNEYDPKNDAIKGFDVVKKSKTGDSLYTALTFSGKVLEKTNREGWKQTYPV